MASFQKPPCVPLFGGKWSNEKCIEIAFSDNFPAYVKDLAIQKSIINRFLNFYLGGKKQKGLTVCDLAFAVISIMPQHELTEDFLWDVAHYKEDGKMFFMTPEDKLKAEVGHIKLDENMEEKLLNGHKDDIQTHKNDQFDEEDKKTFNGNDENNKTDKEANHNAPDAQKNEKVETREAPTRSLSENNINQENTETRNNKDDQKPTTSSTKSNQERESIPKFPTNIKWYSRAPTKKVETENPPEYGPVQNSAFIKSCNKLLDDWDTNTTARIVLKYFFGIVALILMRATTKNTFHLKNTFASNKFLSTISFTKNHLQYSVPHKKCVRKSHSTFKNRDGNIPIMFAKIVVNSFHIDALRRDIGRGAYPKLNILKLTILSHTADYGFGLLSMLQNIEEKLGENSLNKVIEATYCDLTAESWKRLKFFAQTFMVDRSKEATHHWARVISSDFFNYLSCKANLELSVILGVFIEKITGCSEIWQSNWAKTVPNLKALKEIGLDMYKSLPDLRPDSKKEDGKKEDGKPQFREETPKVFESEDNLLLDDDDSSSHFDVFDQMLGHDSDDYLNDVHDSPPDFDIYDYEVDDDDRDDDIFDLF